MRIRRLGILLLLCPDIALRIGERKIASGGRRHAKVAVHWAPFRKYGHWTVGVDWLWSGPVRSKSGEENPSAEPPPPPELPTLPALDDLVGVANIFCTLIAPNAPAKPACTIGYPGKPTVIGLACAVV